VRVRESRGLWVVQLANSLFVTVPKRALSAEDQAAFAAFLAARVKGTTAIPGATGGR
jgi:hypothetical protein